MKLRSFSAKAALILALLSGLPGVVSQAYAGIPVIDASNLTQNVVTAIEDVAQTLKQIDQYRLQLQQYQNQIQNTAAPLTNTWDAAQSTMSALDSKINTLNYYKATLGSVNSYLGKFPDTSTYMASPCYSPSGCTPAQWAALQNSRTLGGDSQKRATDALFQGLDQQQSMMQTDANQLKRLQTSAQSATGQMQAIGYANQLASHQSNQLLQIRGLLIAQQNVIATRDQALANREAQQAAADAVALKATFHPSPVAGF